MVFGWEGERKKYGGCGHNVEGGVRLGRMDRNEEKILELPPNLGLGTIYIAPFYGRTDLTAKVWVRNLGTT